MALIETGYSRFCSLNESLRIGFLNSKVPKTEEERKDRQWAVVDYSSRGHVIDSLIHTG